MGYKTSLLRSKRLIWFVIRAFEKLWLFWMKSSILIVLLKIYSSFSMSLLRCWNGGVGIVIRQEDPSGESFEVISPQRSVSHEHNDQRLDFFHLRYFIHHDNFHWDHTTSSTSGYSRRDQNISGAWQVVFSNLQPDRVKAFDRVVSLVDGVHRPGKRPFLEGGYLLAVGKASSLKLC